MSTRGFREMVVGISKLLWLVFRHLAALLIWFAFSHLAVLPGLAFIMIFGHQVGSALVYTLVGFCGVFMGVRYLPQSSRRVGSIVFTVLGCIYFYHFVAIWGDVNYEGKIIHMYDESLVHLITLAFGGLVATTLAWWTSSTHLRPSRRHGFDSSAPLAS